MVSPLVTLSDSESELVLKAWMPVPPVAVIAPPEVVTLTTPEPLFTA